MLYNLTWMCNKTPPPTISHKYLFEICRCCQILDIPLILIEWGEMAQHQWKMVQHEGKIVQVGEIWLWHDQLIYFFKYIYIYIVNSLSLTSKIIYDIYIYVLNIVPTTMHFSMHGLQNPLKIILIFGMYDSLNYKIRYNMLAYLSVLKI